MIVTVGGSATTDGGAGALEALEDAGVTVELDVLCDVRVPFEQAPSVFGPQKGADPAMVKRLEQRLDKLAATLDRDPRGEPMTGAAGGLSGGLWGRHGANLQHGASFVLDLLGFDELMRGSAFVVTGEGRIDEPDAPGENRRGAGHTLPAGRGDLPCDRRQERARRVLGPDPRSGVGDGGDHVG